MDRPHRQVFRSRDLEIWSDDSEAIVSLIGHPQRVGCPCHEPDVPELTRPIPRTAQSPNQAAARIVRMNFTRRLRGHDEIEGCRTSNDGFRAPESRVGCVGWNIEQVNRVQTAPGALFHDQRILSAGVRRSGSKTREDANTAGDNCRRRSTFQTRSWIGRTNQRPGTWDSRTDVHEVRYHVALRRRRC